LTAQTQPSKEVLGAHDMSGTSSVTGPNANACIYCHVPHGGNANTLWNQTLSNQNYTFYTSGSNQNASVQPSSGDDSSKCLSCHDGTVAVGQTIGIGTLKMSGQISDVLGTHLEGSHPFSLQLPLKDAANLVPNLVASGTTKDPAVKLINGNVECSSCHNPHNQYVDKRAGDFLVRDNAGSPICLACHGTSARTVNGHDNSLSQWLTTVHGTSPAQVALKAGLGNYSTVAEYGCESCHVAHNSTGPGILRKNTNRPPNVDDTAQSCFICHDGSTNLVQPILNVLADFQKTGHPFSDPNNLHTLGESIVLDKNRHATCADCHASHASNPTTSFGLPPALRPSQNAVGGVAMDGTQVKSATNQYENCLRCHGASLGKQSLTVYGYMPARALYAGDTLNVLLQFANTATSEHPVMRDATGIRQPSLLKFMWDVSGKQQSRAMGVRIFCTDCHNSETNREFGGTGPNGPHGSRNDHILERPYLMSRVDPASGPGSTVINLVPSPILDPTSSPFALCAKCHDLTNVNSNLSFTEHNRHIQDGFSCSTCHSAHGVQAGTLGVMGMRLVSFDMNVVAPLNGSVSYTSAGCNLRCHNHDHVAH
jgi:predicted CXXCH cytochrome family protein